MSKKVSPITGSHYQYRKVNLISNVEYDAANNPYCIGSDYTGFQPTISLQYLPVGINLNDIIQGQNWWIVNLSSTYTWSLDHTVGPLLSNTYTNNYVHKTEAYQANPGDIVGMSGGHAVNAPVNPSINQTFTAINLDGNGSMTITTSDGNNLYSVAHPSGAASLAIATKLQTMTFTFIGGQWILTSGVGNG